MNETFVAALARHARERPDALALVDDRARLTWREAAARVESAAGWLGARVPRGAAALGWLPNAVEWYLLRLACERAGLLWVPAPATLGAREIASIAARVRPALLVTARRFRGRDYQDEADLVHRETGLAPLRLTTPEDCLLALDGPPPPATAATQPHEDAHVLPTSGSEGTPKLSRYTLAAAAERGHAQAALLRLTPDDVVLALSAGTGPAKTPWLAAPIAGATVVATPIFQAETALAVAGRERATVICGTPAQLTLMLPHVDRVDLSRVRLWYTSGSVLPPALAAELETRTPGHVLSVYGATDFGGWAAADLDDPPGVRHRTVGRPRGGTELRIVDGDGREAPPGVTGEIVGRGPSCVAGYVGDPALTRERWPQGWFRTGDLGRVDEQGNLVILGRARDVIIRGGENIAPEEVETLLRTHPAVHEVAVVGAPDPVLGERVCACVVPRAGAAPTLEALRDHARAARIAHYKLPERLLVVPELPRVGDKLDRGALAVLAAAQSDVAAIETGARAARRVSR